MKIKSNIITAIILVSFFIAGTTIMRAQGFYSNENTVKETEIKKESEEGGGFFKAPPPGGGEERPPAPGDDEPIGEGILILSLLAGGYALVKRKVKRKYED